MIQGSQEIETRMARKGVPAARAICLMMMSLSVTRLLADYGRFCSCSLVVETDCPKTTIASVCLSSTG